MISLNTPRFSNPTRVVRILYKTRLPFILVFNKIDAQSHDFALTWMTDFEVFQKALHSPASHINGEPSYMNSLTSSMCLVLDEFYSHLKTVGVSAMTGEGIDGFFEAVEEARREWERDYKPELERVAKLRVSC
jgi:GPN-loop GTPase